MLHISFRSLINIFTCTFGGRKERGEGKKGRLCHCAVAVVTRVGLQERVVIIILPSVLGSHEYSGHFIKIDSSNVYIRS